MGDAKTVTGVVRRMDRLQGTKSAHSGVVLVSDDGDEVPLFYPGDNPFENTRLDPFVGQSCRVTGSWRGTRFVVETIESLGAKPSDQAPPESGAEP